MLLPQRRAEFQRELCEEGKRPQIRHRMILELQAVIQTAIPNETKILAITILHHRTQRKAESTYS